MKKTAILGLIFLLLISGCIGTNSSIEQYNKQYKNDDEQCKRAITDYFEAVKTHDLDRLKSLYSTERRKMAQNASLGEDEYEFINISQIVPDKSVVYEYMTFGRGKNKKEEDIKGYKVDFEFKLKNKAKVMQDHFKFILVKESGNWKIDDFGH